MNERHIHNPGLMHVLEQGFGVRRREMIIPEVELFELVITDLEVGGYDSDQVIQALNFIYTFHDTRLCNPEKIANANDTLGRFSDYYFAKNAKSK